jgi:hypothetical protein
VENTSFKLWYTRKEQNRNDVDILIDKSLKNEIIAVKRQEDGFQALAILISTFHYEKQPSAIDQVTLLKYV